MSEIGHHLADLNRGVPPGDLESVFEGAQHVGLTAVVSGDDRVPTREMPHAVVREQSPKTVQILLIPGPIELLDHGGPVILARGPTLVHPSATPKD